MENAGIFKLEPSRSDRNYKPRFSKGNTRSFGGGFLFKTSLSDRLTKKTQTKESRDKIGEKIQKEMDDKYKTFLVGGSRVIKLRVQKNDKK